METFSEEEIQEYLANPERRRKMLASTKRKQKRQAFLIVGFIALIIFMAISGLAFYFYSISEGLPSFEQLENPEVDLATIAYTADGKELARYHRKNRSWVHLNEISPYVIQALIATEDHRFYRHWGIDIFRTMTVPYHLLRGRQQGASTITQQLARNLYRQIGFEVSIRRKLREMMTAVQLERNYTKDEILEMYLNTVTFGRHPERAKQRRNVVLAQMVKHGFLSREIYEQLKDEPIQLNLQPFSLSYYRAPYFAEQVRLELQKWGKEHGYNIALTPSHRVRSVF